MAEGAIRAAGGVVWRPAGGDRLEIIVVHRPKYDDWSLPKGKLDPGETWESAAVREVREETGLEVDLGTFVGDVEYLDHRARPKVVRFWEMRAVRGTFTPHREVDAVRWLPPADAISVLTHRLDQETVRRFLALRE